MDAGVLHLNKTDNRDANSALYTAKRYTFDQLLNLQTSLALTHVVM